MDISSKKLELIDWLMHINDIAVVKQIEKLKRQFSPLKGEKETNHKKDFANYLLSWPEMTDAEMKATEEKRKHFNKWR